MGRKGVSKRKKATEKNQGTAGNSGSNGRKADAQPAMVEKAKTWTKDKKKN